MLDEKRVVTLNDYEQRLMVRGLTDFRNDALRDGRPTEDVDDLILKVIDAPTKREKRRAISMSNSSCIPRSSAI